MEIEERFWSKVSYNAHNEKSCWVWEACKTSDGYGSFHVVDKMVNAHRGTVGWHNRVKTHCPKGHAYDVNRPRSGGSPHRGCKTCQREYTRQYRLRKAAMAA